MSARLLFRDNQGRDGEVVLTQSAPTYVGRALDCAIRTDDAMVSRKHSMIRMEGGHYIVEDLGSANGTHVNDVRVTKQSLAHNDVVRCGSLWLRYVEDGPLVSAGAAGSAPPVSASPGADALGYAGTMAANQQELPQPPQPSVPYGGPPAMPGLSNASGGQVASAATPQVLAPDSVVVNLDGSPELAKARDNIAATRQQLEDLQARYDREVADGKRLRAETSTLRDRLDDLRRDLAEKDDVVAAHDRVAEELRGELRSSKEALLAQKSELAELADTVAAKERQLERISGDVSKVKDEVEQRDRQLVELSRTKDDGWKKLNEQLSEIEHFREVITEQERMLEERRVGLVSQEEVIKELRDGKESMLSQVAKLKAENEEMARDEARQRAKIEAIDEENRRLSRMLAEAQGGGEHGSVEHSARQSAELKELRVEVKTLEADRGRLEALHRSSESALDRMQERLAKLEVELREAREAREKALSARMVAEQALTKAELARHKAEENALSAAQDHETDKSGSEELRFELEKAQRKIAELEKNTAPAVSESDLAELSAKLHHAEAQVAELTAELQDTQTSLERSLADMKAAKEVMVGSKLKDPDSTAVRISAAPPELLDKTIEVHDGINDSLSEIRNNLLLIQGEFETFAGGDSSESSRTIADTLKVLVGNAEEAKGVLRSLKELIEFS